MPDERRNAVTTDASAPHPRRPPAAGWGGAAALGCALLLGIFGGLLPLRPPQVPPSSTPPTEFSAARAARDVAVLAAAPHPIGTPRQREVRDHLVDRLRDLGLEPHVQVATVVRAASRDAINGARVENVVARLPGTAGSDHALLLLAHYDSVPNSPGAADDAAGVAAVLETIRALRASPPLAGDVIVLFTDGEEPGLFGAQAFVEQHRWRDDVRLVLNFEARGTRGPSIMFETGPGVGSALMRRYAAASPRPVASSYSADVYRYLPNDSDFTRFRQAGVPGFNFAFIQGLARYHSRLDDPAHLDLRSLQHHGIHALGLTRNLAAGGLADLPRGGPAVYFNLPLVGLLVYPASWGMAAALLAALVALAVVAIALYRRRVRAGRLFASLIVLPLGAAAAALAALVLHRSVAALGGLGPSRLESPWPYLAAFVALGLVAAWASQGFARWLGRRELLAAALVWWLLLVALGALAAPSGSYLVVWPLLLASAAAAFWLGDAEAARRPRRFIVASSLCLLVTLILWTPLLYLVGIAFDVAAAALLATLATLVGGLLIPLLPLPRPRRLAATLAGAALLVLLPLLWALATGGSDAGRPRPNTLFYVLDHGGSEAYWATFDGRTDAWTERFLADGSVQPVPDLFDREPYDLLRAAAPQVPLPPPVVRRVAEERLEDGRRQLTLRVRSPRGGSRMRIALGSGDGALSVSGIDGQPVPAPDGEGTGHVEIRLHGAAEAGFELKVLAPEGPLDVTLTDRTYGLDPRQGGSVALPGWSPRPPDQAPRPSTPSDFVEVRTTARI